MRGEKDSLHVDICIIGAGSGGLSVAAVAAKMDLHVALIERGEMGGDCLNTGCVPSKSLLAAAKAAQHMRKSGKYGIVAQDPEINFPAVKDHIEEVIAGIAPHDSQERFEGLGVKVIRARARFLDKNTVQAGAHIIKAQHFVIAAGGRPFIPPIEGLDPEKIHTNETIFDLREKPEHLIIIGGGPIGIEMAQAHIRLGCKISVLERNTILPKDDPELPDIIRKSLKEEGADIIEGTDVNKIIHLKNGKVRVEIKKNGDKRDIEASHILVATGRTPNTEDLGLDAAGISYDKKSIKVDKRLRTNRKHIYAIGDIAGGPQFTHIASYHAGIVIRNMLFKWPAGVDYSALPWVTYTDPELAHVGLTEEAAREKHGRDIEIIKWEMKENDRARAEKRTEGLAKIITRKNGKILGASIAAPHAGEMIGLWGLAISKGLKIGAVANMIMPYPTYGEAGKRAAGAFYEPKLFGKTTRRLVSWLYKLPF